MTKGAEIRERILKQAAQVFNRRGYFGTSLTDIRAFQGTFSDATAVGVFSGEEMGFSFRSGRATTARGYALMWRERNGSFLR